MLMAGDTSSHVTYIHAGRPESRVSGHQPLRHHALEFVTRSGAAIKVSTSGEADDSMTATVPQGPNRYRGQATGPRFATRADRAVV